MTYSADEHAAFDPVLADLCRHLSDRYSVTLAEAIQTLTGAEPDPKTASAPRPKPEG